MNSGQNGKKPAQTVVWRQCKGCGKCSPKLLFVEERPDGIVVFTNAEHCVSHPTQGCTHPPRLVAEMVMSAREIRTAAIIHDPTADHRREGPIEFQPHYNRYYGCVLRVGKVT